MKRTSECCPLIAGLASHELDHLAELSLSLEYSLSTDGGETATESIYPLFTMKKGRIIREAQNFEL